MSSILQCLVSLRMPRSTLIVSRALSHSGLKILAAVWALCREAILFSGRGSSCGPDHSPSFGANGVDDRADNTQRNKTSNHNSCNGCSIITWTLAAGIAITRIRYCRVNES